MAKLMVFRKKTVPSDTSFGDDVGVSPAGKSEVSENLSEQVESGLVTYRTSVPFESGSTRVFFDGVYMTRGLDYDESSDNKIVFKEDWEDSFVEDVSILSIFYKAK